MKIIMYHPDKIDTSKEVKKEGFNWVGLFLSYFYYLFRGMWKKGLLLMLTSLAIYEIVGTLTGSYEAGRGVAKIVSIYCAFSFNKDYYKYLLKNEWKEKR